jgi:peptidyl-prolyl cis-trans isomerase C
MEAVFVDGAEIAPEAIAAEMQYHPARSREAAWAKAATALVLRHLLLAEAGRLGMADGAETSDESGAEEALIQALLLREVSTPVPDEATCRRYWSANGAKYRAPDLYEAAHILFPAAPDDDAARAAAKQAADETLTLLRQDPTRFAELARERSACPSAASGGLLGQQTRGDLVPEMETFIFGLDEGQICPVPIATRYGYHVLRLDRLVRGEALSFAAARPLIERHLTSHSWQRAVSQYLRLLVGRARIEGLPIAGAVTPLVQ